MEHCGFVTLEHVLAHDRLTALTALSIFIQAMRGVSELHLRGLMHRCTCVASWQSSA